MYNYFHSLEDANDEANARGLKKYAVIDIDSKTSHVKYYELYLDIQLEDSSIELMIKELRNDQEYKEENFILVNEFNIKGQIIN